MRYKYFFSTSSHNRSKKETSMNCPECDYVKRYNIVPVWENLGKRKIIFKKEKKNVKEELRDY